jgi:hypothetical protein
MQLVKRDNSETTLVQAGGEVYLWNGASTFTSQGSVSTSARLRGTYWSLGDYLVITDTAKAAVVKKWDGSTLSTQTTGLASDLYAKYGVVHQGRVWLFNVTCGTDTPHLMVASKYEDPTVFSTSLRGGATTSGGGAFATGLEAFYLLTPDLKPINGAIVFFGQLIISTEGGRLFKLTGSTGATYAWTEYYAGSSATGAESMADIGNDVMYLKAGGGIDLLSTTQTSGDVAADDMSRWIATTTSGLTSAITVYDQTRNKVFMFVADKVLVFYKDLAGSEISPWSVWTTQESFGMNTNAAKYMKLPGTQTYTVLFGDSAGRVLNINGTGLLGDAGSQSIAVSRKTRFIADGEGSQVTGQSAAQVRAGMSGALRLQRRVLNGVVTYRRVAEPCNLTVSFDWGDEYNESYSVIPLKGAPDGTTATYFSGTSTHAAYYGGTYYYSQGGAYANKISSQSFSPTGRGPGFFMTAYIDTVSDFQIDFIDIL